MNDLFSKWIYGPGFYMDADAAGGGTPPPDAGGNGGKNFTQEQVDALVGTARQAGRKTGIAKLMKDLGVTDAEALKKLVEAAKTADDANKTETQKLTDKLTEAEKKATDLEADAAKKLVAIQECLLQSEIKIAAGRTVTDKDGKVTRAAFRLEALEDLGLLIDRSLITEKDGKYAGIEKESAGCTGEVSALPADRNGSQRNQTEGYARRPGPEEIGPVGKCPGATSGSALFNFELSLRSELWLIFLFLRPVLNRSGTKSASSSQDRCRCECRATGLHHCRWQSCHRRCQRRQFRQSFPRDFPASCEGWANRRYSATPPGWSWTVPAKAP